jgi:uncharacterized protein (TIGR02757 family)
LSKKVTQSTTEKTRRTTEIGSLKEFLDAKVIQYNTPAFIEDDPISIPHLFNKKQDIEISGFFAAILAWGLRKTIITKCKELMQLMDWSPHDFVSNYSEADLKSLKHFKHRTFKTEDLFYFLEWFRDYYKKQDSLEDAFARFIDKPHRFQKPVREKNVEKALIGFHDLFFSIPDFPQRTQKHIATPLRNSSCKRLNMFLRWMVRRDNAGVDFGIWKRISPGQLLCPVDLHVERVARKLGLITSTQVNWKETLELTEKLKFFDKEDPVKYDFALFGLGVMEGYGK